MSENHNDNVKLTPGATIFVSMIMACVSGIAAGAVSGWEYGAIVAAAMGGFLVSGLLLVIFYR